MNLPLPQALDFLHSQLLSSMCISPPVRKDNEPPAPFVSPPLKRHFQWPPGTPDPPPDPPSFHVWITRKVAPHMAVVDLRCDTVPWACFRRGPAGQHQHQFGIHSGDFIQFVFPATDDYPADCGFFSFALYITKVALKGRVVLENPDQVGDPSAAQVTQLVGIVLPFLLHNSVQIPGGKGVAPVSQALYQLRLPVLDRLNTTVETCVLPPISLSLSFLVPVSAFPGLFQHLVGVPFYRLPKTLGWPYSDAPLNGALIPDPPLAPLNLAPLLSLLRVLPFFTPPSVRNKVTNHLQGESGCHYTLDAIVYILEKGMRPGTKKTDGDIETTYDWPLNWEIPDFTSDLCKGLSTHHPEVFQLLTSLGRRFIAKFLIALLAADGHFITLLLSTLWGLRGGFTTLCLQGIFGAAKTYCASMMFWAFQLSLPPNQISHSIPLPIPFVTSYVKHLTPFAPNTLVFSLRTSRSLLLSTTARKIAPTYFRKILLFAVSSSPRVAYYVNCATPTLISPPASKRFAWPSTTNLNKAGRQGSP